MLRYAGGKTRAIKVLTQHIPETDAVVSPFLGGGSFELSLARRGIRVYASDIYSPLMCFWRCMKSCRTELMDKLYALYPVSKETYRLYQQTLNEGTELERAIKFFVVNRLCFSGCITGGYSGTRFTLNNIAALGKPDLANLHLDECDYETQLAKHPETFAFLDPPYDVPNLYGSQTFDHDRLANVLRHRTSNWLLCYNDTPRIRSLYEGWTTILPVSWSYGMNASKSSNEILISPLHNEVPPGTRNGREA